MRWPARRQLILLLLILLGSFLVYRGVLPAFSHIDTDFPNYYTAAKLVAEGRDTHRLYDDAWFQERMYEYGFQVPGKFSPFPPATALVFLPLTTFEPLTALRITTIINLWLVVLSVVLLSRLLSIPVVDSAVFILLSGLGLTNCLRFGQLYILVSFLCIVGYFAYKHGKPLLAGASLGLLIPIKYYPAVLVLCFALKGEWRVVLASVATVVLVTTISLLVLGWDVHYEYLSSVVGSHLRSQLSQQDPFSSTFQSFDSLFRWLFMIDPLRNPDPVFALPWFPMAKVVITVLLLLAGVCMIVLAKAKGMDKHLHISIGILGILVLLISPATATYHFLLLWLPVGLLISYCLARGHRFASYALLTLYGAIGFIPYGLARGFEGRGMLTLLAYPRLFLLLAMFIVTLYVIWNISTHESVTVDSTRTRA